MASDGETSKDGHRAISPAAVNSSPRMVSISSIFVPIILADRRFRRVCLIRYLYDSMELMSVSRKHLHRYLSEFEFRHNHRELDDGKRTRLAIKGSEGKRLMYREVIE